MKNGNKNSISNTWNNYSHAQNLSISAVFLLKRNTKFKNYPYIHLDETSLESHNTAALNKKI